MTDFELIVLGFFMGVFFSLIMIMAGVAYSERITKNDRQKHGYDPDMRIYIPSRDRLDRSDTVCNSQTEGAE